MPGYGVTLPRRRFVIKPWMRDRAADLFLGCCIGVVSGGLLMATGLCVALALINLGVAL